MVGFLSSRVHSLLAGLLVLGIVALAGCGGGTKGSVVEGKVTVDGAPANVGQVIFLVGGNSFFADIRPDGSYTVAGLPTGAAQVGVKNPGVVGGGGAPLPGGGGRMSLLPVRGGGQG